MICSFNFILYSKLNSFFKENFKISLYQYYHYKIFNLTEFGFKFFYVVYSQNVCIINVLFSILNQNTIISFVIAIESRKLSVVAWLKRNCVSFKNIYHYQAQKDNEISFNRNNAIRNNRNNRNIIVPCSVISTILTNMTTI